jgi:hypothetical protein
MAQHVAIRALNRSPRLRVIDRTGVKTQLSTVVDAIVDLDNTANRRELSRHGAIGQYIVTAAHNTDATVTLPANT